MPFSQVGVRWRRVIPIAFLMYTVAFMDRVNIGFATKGMAEDFHAGQSMIGLTLGVFFAGYAVLQIPTGYIADRWSAKIWVTILLVFWAVCAVFSGLAQNLDQELWSRFLLGVAEGGLWPAVMVMLAKWFPREERASANALFQMCLPAGALVSAPLSGWLVGQLGWREMLVIEGLPPLLWAVIWWFAVADSPNKAPWLPEAEKNYIETKLAEERKTLQPLPFRVGWKALIHPVVWLLTIAYFFSILGSYGLQLWGPTIVRNSGVSATVAGLLLAIPNFVGIIAMIYCARLSDRWYNRKIVVAFTMFASFIGLLLLAMFSKSPVWLIILFMSLITAGIFARQGPLWAIPSQILPSGAVGFAFALIGLVGNLGGIVGPWLMGYVRGATGSFIIGFLALSASMALAGILVLFVPEKRPIELYKFGVKSSEPMPQD